jgi:nucleolar protein 56
MADYLLFESPVGYSLFKVALQGDAVGNRLKEVQEGVNDLAKFGKMVDLTSFLPFEYVFFGDKNPLGEFCSEPFANATQKQQAGSW